MILREECVYLLVHQLFILGGMILREECVYLLVHQLFILGGMILREECVYLLINCINCSYLVSGSYLVV